MRPVRTIRYRPLPKVFGKVNTNMTSIVPSVTGLTGVPKIASAVTFIHPFRGLAKV